MYIGPETPAVFARQAFDAANVECKREASAIRLKVSELPFAPRASHLIGAAPRPLGALRPSLAPFEAEIRKIEKRLEAGEKIPAAEVAELSRNLIRVDICHDKLTPLLVFDVDNTDEDWVHHIIAALRGMEDSIVADVARIVGETVNQAHVESLSRLQLRRRLSQRLGDELKMLPDDVMSFVGHPETIRAFVHQLFVTQFSAMPSADIVFHDLLSKFLHPTDVYASALAAGIASGNAALVAYDDVATTYDILSNVTNAMKERRYTLAKLGDGLRPGVVRRLDHIRVLKYFDPDLVLTHSDTGVYKPNPAGMLEIMRRVGITDPAQVTMIGDGLPSDMRLDEQPSLKGLKEIYTIYGEPTAEDLRVYRDYRRRKPSDDYEQIPPQRTVSSLPEILHLDDAEWLGVWMRWTSLRARAL